jgi:hypothetical protein
MSTLQTLLIAAIRQVAAVPAEKALMIIFDHFC